MAKKKPDNRQLPKYMTTEECFKCGKKEYYTKDYYSTTKRKPEDKRSTFKAKKTR